MTDDHDYRLAHKTIQSWRRLTLTPTSQIKVNEYLAWLMAQPPHFDNQGRMRGHGPWLNLSTSALPARELLKERGINAVGHKRGGRRFKKSWDKIKHGTASAYQNDCRKHSDGPCGPCRKAWAEYQKKRYQKRNEV
jgi:hypothetical protein